MKFYQVTQGGADWYRLRLGRPTASSFHKIVTPTGKTSTQSQKYLYRLVAERLLYETMDDQLGHVQWVEHGRSNEGNAVALFNFSNDIVLEPGGFVTTDDGRLGASPDRLLKGNREAVEIKCPAPWTQLEYLLEGPGVDYRPQVQGQMLVGGFEAVHFFTYHPQMPPYHNITLPDWGYIATLRSVLSAFCDALDLTTERAKLLGAYAVARRVATPADLAYGEGQGVLSVINPETGAEMGQ